MVVSWSTPCTRAQNLDLDLIWRWPWVGSILLLSSHMWWEGTGKTQPGCSQRYFGKNKDQLSQIVSENFQLDIVFAGKNCFLLQGISTNLIYLPINNLLITDSGIKGDWKNQTTLRKSPAFLHTSFSPLTPFPFQFPHPRPCSAPLLRQCPP